MSTTAVRTADYVNPIIQATRSTFELMLDCIPVRKGLSLRDGAYSSYDVSAVIGISGVVAGTIVLNMPTEVACQVLHKMVGSTADEANQEVCDAIGELANMIAGSAKAQLAQFQLSISIPNVIVGANHTIKFPSNVVPIILSFESEIGPFRIEAGFNM